MNKHRSPVSAKILGLALALCLVAAACGSSGSTSSSTTTSEATTESSATPTGTSQLDLSVGAIPDSLTALQGVFTKYIDVWGVTIVGTAATPDDKMMHAANVMAQYLDNNADGTPDDPAVVEAMVANKATLLMANTPDELENAAGADQAMEAVGAGGQDLYASETNPEGGFDAALEEVQHLILNTGWAKVYPEQLAQADGSKLAAAMDLARGGHFTTIPSPYPAGAWYIYDDETCDYSCMLTEYFYWASTSLLGAQENRASDIANEWKLATPAEVESGDPDVTAILKDPALSLPTTLPDGNYQG